MRVSLSPTHRLNMLSNLTTMLQAGIPLASTIATLLEDAKGSEKIVLLHIQDEITAGKSMAEALSGFPKIFDTVTINLVRASEQAGTLEQTLQDLVKTSRKDIEFADRVKGAMFYPLMVMVVFFVVLLAILLIVMPKISQVFSRMKIPLPLPTRIMIASSSFMVNYWPFVLGGFILLGGLLFVLYREYRTHFNRMLLSLPGISHLSRQIDITRFTRSMHLLLMSGITITNALELAQGVVANHRVIAAIQRGRDQASTGLPFSAGIKGKDSPFPAMMIKLIEVGEQTGTLEKSMKDVSSTMDYEVTKTLKKLTMMLEPLMLLLIGLAVGGMMMAIIGPIYGMIGQVGNR